MGPLLLHIRTRKGRALRQPCLDVWWELLKGLDLWVITQPACTELKACLLKKACQSLWRQHSNHMHVNCYIQSFMYMGVGRLEDQFDRKKNNITCEVTSSFSGWSSEVPTVVLQRPC